MWIPKGAEEIERAAKAGDLVETAAFDGKADLPAVPKKNPDLAKDVAAMATDGGSLLYGVSEDAQERLTVLSPILLTGAADRVDQIVSNSIAEVPFFAPYEYRCTDDDRRGYLLLVVPQSERAPHQVTVGGDLRYYGRGAKGNRILTEGEVARLYERRQSWAVDRDELLAVCIADAPVFGTGAIHAFARPVAPDQGMFERAVEALGGFAATRGRLTEVASGTRLRDTYDPSLVHAAYWEQRGADEYRLATLSEEERSDPERAPRLAEARFNIDGRSQLFCGRASDVSRGASDVRVIFEVIVAGSLEAFLALLGLLYDAAGYMGSVDIGVAVTGIQGAGSFSRSRNGWVGDLSYPAASFTRTRRVAARQLGEPHVLAHDLLRRFYGATSGRPDFNPFESP